MIYLKSVITLFVSSVAWLLGGVDCLILGLAWLMVADYITGLMVGFKRDELSSKRAGAGIKKKIGVWFLITCSVVLARAIGRAEIRTLVASFYIATEILSIVENLSKIGVPVPRVLKKALEQCRDGSCDEDKCNFKRRE